MAMYLWPFLILTGLAVLWSAGIHTGALLGVTLTGETAALQSSLVYLWFPSMLSWAIARRRRGRPSWMAPLLGCPRPLRWLVLSLAVNSLAALLLEHWLGAAPHGSALAVSAQALALYSLAFGLIYSLLFQGGSTRTDGAVHIDSRRAPVVH